MSIYLDYNASAPIDPRVVDFMMDIYRNNIGNADSRTHDFGDNARMIVENARKQVARLLFIPSEDIFFTSGATESNNIAFQGLKEYAQKTGKKHIVTTTIEHKAVLETAKHMERNGFKIDFVSPDRSGRIQADEVLSLINDNTLLVSVMHVNNETGIIQPVNEISDMLEGQDVFFHVDATQSCGKLVDELKNLRYDMLSFSSHKLYGPQGIGALVLRRKNYKLPPIKPIMFGGQQERGISPGTVPVALAAGFGKACELALNEYKKDERDNLEVRDMLIDMLESSGIRYKINGDIKQCISSTMNIQLEGVSSEALMLSSKEYCGISNGSACTSNNYSPSYVLLAMGISEDDIDQSIRLSWGRNVNVDELKYNFEKLLRVAKGLV